MTYKNPTKLKLSRVFLVRILPKRNKNLKNEYRSKRNTNSNPSFICRY